MKWIFAELHTHTCHSDGVFSTPELCRAAAQNGLDVLAITDHNTMAPIAELTPSLERETLPVLRGMEWTTYFGHMCVLGEGCRTDWRDASVQNIHEKLREIKRQGGLAGIAHPFDLGSPLCTGCHWKFQVADYTDVDYIEVWHGPFPPVHIESERSLAFWSGLLDRGERIAAVYGRDWHRPDTAATPYAVTCLQVEEGDLHHTAFEALRRGRTGVTMGPLLILEGESGRYLPGDAMPAGRKVSARVDMDVRRPYWERWKVAAEKITLRGEGNRVLAEFPAQAGGSLSLPADAGGYVRAELTGQMCGRACLLAMTSAIYLK